MMPYSERCWSTMVENWNNVDSRLLNLMLVSVHFLSKIIIKIKFIKIVMHLPIDKKLIYYFQDISLIIYRMLLFSFQVSLSLSVSETFN